MTRRNWTPEEDAALQALVAKGNTTAAIARSIGRPESSIYSRITSLANRQMPRAAKPAKEGSGQARTKRPCLCCRESFMSDGPHNRLCSRCRRLEKTPFDF